MRETNTQRYHELIQDFRKVMLAINERSAISLDTPLADDAGNSFTIADIVPDPAAQAALDDVAERERQQKLHDILEQALAQLPANQREAIRAKHYWGQQADVNAYSAAMKALRHPKVSSKLREYF